MGRRTPNASGVARAPVTRPTRESDRDRAVALASAAVLLIVIVSRAVVSGGLARLPGALLGGDLYYQMGCVRSIAASLDPMASCSTSGALPGYLPLYGTLIAALSRVAQLDAFDAMRLGAVLFAGLATWIVARVTGRFFGRGVGWCLAGLWSLAHAGLIARYTDFAGEIVAPLLFSALALYLIERSARAAVFLGGILAVSGYTHAVLFAGASALTVAVVGIDAARRGEAPWSSHLRGVLARAAIVLALGALALGYWWKPIVVFGGRTSAHYTDWNGGPSLLSMSDRLDYTLSVLARALDPRTPVEPIVTVLAIAGAIVIARRRDPAAWRIAGLLALLAALYCLHYFVTMPLFGVHFVPEYAIALLWGFARFLLAGAALAALATRLGAPRAEPGFAWAGVAIAALGGWATLANPALESGRTPLHPSWTSLQGFVLRETQPDDVFLSNNELSFGVAALTGRKTLTSRRAQNDAFLDLDARNLDAARILYGNDPDLRRRLLDRYDVKFVFWTDEWASTEFYFDANGRSVDYDDPLMWFESPERDRLAAEAGVRLVHHLGWVDPMLRGERYPRFPLTIVAPDNYARPDRPWNPDLDRWLERVWSYDEGGRTIAALYRVHPRDARRGSLGSELEGHGQAGVAQNPLATPAPSVQPTLPMNPSRPK